MDQLKRELSFVGAEAAAAASSCMKFKFFFGCEVLVYFSAVFL